MAEAAATRPRSEEPAERQIALGGVALTYFEWEGPPGRAEGDAPTVLLAHATGFHARIWDAVVRLLPDFRVLALDMRGHGRSEKTGEPDSWEVFADDTAAFARALDLRGVLAVGHSMGGHSVTLAAARDPDVFGGLLLVDPVMPLEGRPLREGRGAADFVRRRRNEWSSPEEMVDRFRDRFPYSSWRADVLEDYVRWGLLPNADGDGHVLACPPDIEGGTYAVSGNGPAMAEVIPRVRIPVAVMRARQAEPGVEAPPFSTSPTPPQLASLFPDGEDLLLSDRSHFIPMEAPEVVAEQVRALDRRVRAREG